MPGVKRVRIITDGACLGNPGPGGWAAILRFGPYTKELFGSARYTTNNRMEIAAAIEGLRALKETCEVEITTDSEYLKNGITSWINNWKRNGWMTKAKKPVINREMWMALDELVAKHHANWRWTRGHANDPENERADELASRAAREQIASPNWEPDPSLPRYDLESA